VTRNASQHAAGDARFVIIVLGEGVIQVLTAVASLWTLSLLYRFAGVPGLDAAQISTRHATALNCATAATIAAIAAGLGSAIEHVASTFRPVAGGFSASAWPRISR
jgi:hypothetical protein